MLERLTFGGDGPASGPIDGREVDTQRWERLTFLVMVQHQVPWMGGWWAHRGWRDLPSRRWSSIRPHGW